MATSDMPEWFWRYVNPGVKYYYAVEAGAEAFIYNIHVEVGSATDWEYRYRS